MRRRLTAWIVACGVVGQLGLARADDATPPVNNKRIGDQAMDEGRPADALAAYSAAYAISKDPALLYNKGRALQALTEYPAALAELEEFDRAAPPELKQRVPGLAKIISDVRQRVTTVTISCDVPGAKVRIRDRAVGTCPLPAPVSVNAGKAHLDVAAEGYFSYERDVELPAGGTASFDVALVSKARVGILAVRSSVPYVDVSVDGKSVGTTPVEASLLAGPHAIELARKGYRRARTSVVVRAGERHDLNVPLEAEPSIVSRWWFWTIAAGVVAAGVTTAIVLTTDKSAEPGTIPPGIVRAGLSALHF